MKKVILIIITILLPSIQIFSQWSQISAINTPQLNAVKFFNESTGITVGQGGIWRSVNSGFNWTQIISTGQFNAISFSDVNNGTAVGDSGLIMRTSDNGISWFQEFSPTTNNLYAVACPNVSNRFALGQNGVFVRFFINTWSLVSTMGYDIYDIKMLGTNNGYIVGSQNNEIVRSTVNGGTNWFTALNNSGRLNSIYCFNSNSIITVGANSRVQFSTNSGLSWNQSIIEPGHELNVVTFSDIDTGYTAGHDGVLLKSVNKGLNWVLQNSNTSQNIRAMSFINGQTGWIVGSNGVISKTSSGGITNINPLESDEPMHTVLFQNYPNPFNSTTQIKFNLNSNSYVNIDLFDITGKFLFNLVNQFKLEGSYTYSYNFDNLSSGVYFYKMLTNSLKSKQDFTKIMIIVK